jgi:hypothetical protein
MAFQRGIDGPEPLRPEPVARLAGAQEERRDARTWRLAEGTLACPACDAPVALTAGPVAPAAPLACPVCAHGGAVRDFLSLAPPTRPARVQVRLSGIALGRRDRGPRVARSPR